DFRSYLAQRRKIISRPEVILAADSPRGKDWKSPLMFALQGLVLPTAICSLIAGLFFFFVKEPDPGWKANERQYSEGLRALEDLEQEILAAAPEQTFRFSDEFIERDRDDALQECRDRITKLKARGWLFRAAPHVDRAERRLRRFLPPAMLIFAAYFFRWFLRFGQGRSAMHVDRAHEVYLFFVTSCIFWVNLLHSTCLVVLLLALRTEKELMLTPAYVCTFALGITGLVLLNKECKKLMPVFNLPLLEGKKRKRSGHHKIFSTIFYSNALSLALSYVLLVLAAWGWGLVAYWLTVLRPK
ncbi:MAG: hypothetical protein ACYSUQ_10620, partial [Planctomycetota bacterium]